LGALAVAPGAATGRHLVQPEGIADESFYETLEQIRQEAWSERDPLAPEE
jgi:hypothetical protein